MLTWEEARRSLYPLPGGVRTESVPLDFIAPAPCLACGDPAETAYRGRPFHVLCTVELAIYAELVRRGDRPPLGLPSGLSLDGSANPLELPVGR